MTASGDACEPGWAATVAALVGSAPVVPADGSEVVPGARMATDYDSVDGGNCSLPAAPADHLDVALSEVEYGTADACAATSTSPGRRLGPGR